MSVWGSIDILNELRKLEQPQFGKHRHDDRYSVTARVIPEGHGPEAEFEDIYIILEELGDWSCRQEKRASDLEYVNDYLEDALNAGKCLSWGREQMCQKILTAYY